MKCEVFIDDVWIGNVQFKIIDPTMGGISGDLICNENYKNFQKEIQKHTEEKGISNSTDFNYRIITENKTELKPQGGIGIIDSKELDELFVECYGTDLLMLEI